jgi:hypothetical protein
MMWVTTIDRDWSDLVVRTCFVPLVQQVVRYLAGALEHVQPHAWQVGDVVVVDPPPGRGPLSLERPDGGEVPVSRPDAATAASESGVEIAETDLPGHYTLHRTAARARAVVFAVNADRIESDLTAVDPDALQLTLSRPGEGIPTHRPALEQAQPGEESGERTRLWPYILVALFGLLISEAWLAIRG